MPVRPSTSSSLLDGADRARHVLFHFSVLVFFLANLDRELQQFLVRWFPHEVKQKEKSNRKEAAKEELEEMGIPDRKCLIM
jgi:hypothetical protein